jgi:alpha-glucosidase
VTSGGVLTVPVAANGGFAVRLCVAAAGAPTCP